MVLDGRAISGGHEGRGTEESLWKSLVGTLMWCANSSMILQVGAAEQVDKAVRLPALFYHPCYRRMLDYN